MIYEITIPEEVSYFIESDSKEELAKIFLPANGWIIIEVKTMSLEEIIKNAKSCGLLK